MLRISVIALATALPMVLAGDCSTQNYITIPGFTGSNGCIPGGYFQAQDLGQPTEADLIQRCEAQCTSYGASCEAYTAQMWKAADSNLYTGQCYYYGPNYVPTAPQQCVNHPTILLAERKDHSLQCLSSSTAAASAYCSSVLSIGTVTTYVTTVTPVTTTTVTESTTRVVSKKTITTTATTSTKTVSKVTQGTTTTTSTEVVPFTTVVTSTSSSISDLPDLDKRTTGAAVAAPSCLASAPPALVTSACSCLNLVSTTISLTATAPTSTGTVTKTKQTATTSFTTSTKINISKATTTLFSTSLSITTAFQTVSSTSTSTATAFTTIIGCNGGPTYMHCGPYPFCTNTDYDFYNCGGCGQSCANSQICSGGSCHNQ